MGTDVLSNMCSYVKASTRCPAMEQRSPQRRGAWSAGPLSSGSDAVDARGSTRSRTASRAPRPCALHVEQRLDALEHRATLVLGEHGSRSGSRERTSSDEVEPSEHLHVGERRALDRPVETAPVDSSQCSRRHRPCGTRSDRSTVSVSSATQPCESSRVFQTRAIRPPGRSTRTISESATSWSNQWNACAHVTTSAEPSASGMDSALPRTAVAPGTACRSSASISSSGSTAVTRWPSATSERVSLPVPAPRSTTSHGSSPASQRTASSG